MAKGLNGELTVEYDAETQIVQLYGQGVWTVDMLRQHQLEIADVLDEARRDRRRLLILSDIRDAGTQGPEVEEEIAVFNPIAFDPADRVAMIVASSVAKMQMRRVTHQPNWEFFLSANAALGWLLAHEPRDQAIPRFA